MADDFLAALAEEAGIETGRPAKGKPLPVESPDMQIDATGRMTFKWKSDGIRLIAESLERRKFELWALISVMYQDGSGAKPRVLLNKTRQNLRAASGKSDLIRYLEKQLQRDWAARIEQVKEQIELHHQAGDPMVWAKGEKFSPATYLIRPLVGQNDHTILFADGESSKTTLAVALAISVALGKAIVPGLSDPVQGKVLFLDWETDRETFDNRVAYLCAGAKVSLPEKSIAYKRLYSPLADAADELAELISELDTSLIVVDSISGATSGQISDEVAAMAYFMAVRSFKRTAFSIAHVPKHGEHDRPIGTTFWYNQARALWEIVFDKTEGDSLARIDLICRKSNNDARPKPLGLTLHFEQGGWFYRGAQPGAADETRLPIATRIVHYLEDNGKKTAAEIAEALGKSAGQIHNVLSQQEGKMFGHNKAARDRLWWALSSAPNAPVGGESDPEW